MSPLRTRPAAEPPTRARCASGTEPVVASSLYPNLFGGKLAVLCGTNSRSSEAWSFPPNPHDLRHRTTPVLQGFPVHRHWRYGKCTPRSLAALLRARSATTTRADSGQLCELGSSNLRFSAHFGGVAPQGDANKTKSNQSRRPVAYSAAGCSPIRSSALLLSPLYGCVAYFFLARVREQRLGKDRIYAEDRGCEAIHQAQLSHSSR